MLGVLEDDGFVVYPAAPSRRCTSVSVAAHTFYEKDHPYLLHGPGMLLDLSACTFTELDGGRVRVTGSQLIPQPYTLKLEGARPVAYRTFVLAGIRDPLLISRLEEVEREVVRGVHAYYADVPPESYQIHFYHYGIDAVMGACEPCRDLPHEVGLMFEVIAPNQELANAICATVRSSYLHFGYEGRKSTAGNLAFPFAPSDVPFGPVYAFSVYHLLKVPNGRDLFPIELVEV